MINEDKIRPSPDQLLSAIERGEKKSGQGQLKVFLGMAAGVGKTFAMLQRAHQLSNDGVDIIIGWVDTHGRKETAQLVKGLRVFPRKVLEHKGVKVEEMDLDGLLKLRPQIVIVDELAHSNVPGSRNSKRYQDVRELLGAGIDVYTTVNIQHVESRVDTVQEITGITVKETVPDSVLDEATEIILIDLPPEDLFQRLKEGRIYPLEKVELAERNFFKQGNLTALRELALRSAADRVDRDLREFKTLHGIDAAWKSSSRLMVEVFASPYSETLIRWTRQLAETTGATWLGAYVDHGGGLSEDEKTILEHNTQLVRQLGGDFTTIQNQDLVEGLLLIARQNHVTQLVISKDQERSIFKLITKGLILNSLIRKSGDIDIYAVSPEKKTLDNLTRYKVDRMGVIFPWNESGWGILTFFASWILAELTYPSIGYEGVSLIFLISVLFSGMYFSPLTVLGIIILLSLLYDFLFIPPIHSFFILNFDDLITYIIFLFALGLAGYLTTTVRIRNKMILTRENQTIQLLNFTHSISEATGVSEIVDSSVKTLNRIFDATTAVILYQDQHQPFVAQGSSFEPASKEMAVAEWVRQNGTPAGRFTETLPSSKALFLPIMRGKSVLGVVALKPLSDVRWDYEQRNFAQALVGHMASGLNREMVKSL
jgi:two-component system sensor histidine kinase KdpD